MQENNQKKKKSPKSENDLLNENDNTEYIEDEDYIENAIKAKKERAKKKASPKKVMEELRIEVADSLADVSAKIIFNDPIPEKNITLQEARSITHPVTRIAQRHIPSAIKKNIPQTTIDSEDLADIIEILVTIFRFFLRRIAVWLSEIKKAKQDKESKTVDAHSSIKRSNVVRENEIQTPHYPYDEIASIADLGMAVE